jgi:outer membrane receptor protein involved in Fe transport
VHTFSPDVLLTVSPFYHYNRANYESSPADFPTSTRSDRTSNYAGVQAAMTATIARNTIEGGIYGFGQRDSNLFGTIFNDGSAQSFRHAETVNGGIVEEFVEDKFKATRWLTLTAGLRQSHFSADITENVTTPRVGAALEVPKLHWVVRGFYGRLYQAPPLQTASGPLLQYANDQNSAFVPLHGERDEEHQFGVTIPYRGWTLDADTFKTRAKNFLDHNNLGESSIFFPVTIDGALVRAWELTVRSPRLWNRGQFYLG